MKREPELWKMNALLAERKELVITRIRELSAEMAEREDAKGRYLKEVSTYLLLLADVLDEAVSGKLLTRTEAELRAQNEQLFAHQMPENYETSFANPTVSVRAFGKTMGRTLSAVYAEAAGIVRYLYQKKERILVYVCELFAEIANLMENEADPAAIKRAFYYYQHDYCGEFLEARTCETSTTADRYYYDLIMKQPLEDLRYLYLFGEPITDNEREMAAFLLTLSEQEITDMAENFVGGYVRGFQVMRLTFDDKKYVEMRCRIGFERVTRACVRLLEEKGKEVLLYGVNHLACGRTYGRKTAISAATLNPQYEYDHRNDDLLFLNKRYLDVYCRMQREAYENVAEENAVYAGPACQECFGEAEFTPVNKPEVITPDARKQKLKSEKKTRLAMLTQEFIDYGTISFTIIAYPLPSIGSNFKEVFADTIRVNTLPNEEYIAIQQKLIDVLDRAEYVEVRGAMPNETNLRIHLHTLSDPKSQTNFENCTADVNIPVGEVFTSPVLAGTEGVLHVKKVYLEGNYFRELRMTFENGKIQSYHCENFPTEEENAQFIKENILFLHDTLPIGEFAIGTNTTAYEMGIKHQIQSVLPILIAEKTGPHFAVGDTCYSHSEDHKVYNPDGKEIIARENEVSALRKENPEAAYMNCHTDITIPYDELDTITAICPDGTRIPVIAGGLFAVPGTEALNVPLVRCKKAAK